MSGQPRITAGKSFLTRYVSVKMRLKASSPYGGDNVKVEAVTDITTNEARALAQLLIAAADESDAKAEKKAAAEQRRKEWRDREIASGRMKVLTWR